MQILMHFGQQTVHFEYKWIYGMKSCFIIAISLTFNYWFVLNRTSTDDNNIALNYKEWTALMQIVHLFFIRGMQSIAGMSGFSCYLINIVMNNTIFKYQTIPLVHLYSNCSNNSFEVFIKQNCNILLPNKTCEVLLHFCLCWCYKTGRAK